MAEPVLLTRALSRTYSLGEATVQALRGVDLSVMPGEMVAILGASGSGKSTLMNLLGCLDRPSAGEYWLAGQRVDSLDDDARADLRNAVLGFVFQGFNLLPRTSAVENVALPLLYDRQGRFQDPEALAVAALRQVGLGERLHHRPEQLSGGQQQRVAIARALVTQPTVLLADEPTGNLDSQTTLEVLGLLRSLNDKGITLLVVTHEDEVAAWCSRAITLKDGQIVSDHAVDHRRGGP